jgi:hypothetical protein
VSKAKLALSFLKECKVEYWYDHGDIRFPCFYCYYEALMNTDSTKWHCMHCKHSGGLFDLIQLKNADQINKELKNAKVFNPVAERRRIRRSFERLIKDTQPDISDRVEELYEKTEELLNWLLISSGIDNKIKSSVK